MVFNVWLPLWVQTSCMGYSFLSLLLCCVFEDVVRAFLDNLYYCHIFLLPNEWARDGYRNLQHLIGKLQSPTTVVQLFCYRYRMKISAYMVFFLSCTYVKKYV